MQNFQITKEFVNEFIDLIDLKLEAEILPILSKLFPADIAELFDQLELEQAVYVTGLLNKEKKVAVLAELEADVRKKFLTGFSPTEIAHEFIESMDSDDAADILNEFPPHAVNEIISHIKDREYARHLSSMLKFHEDTAGGLMGRELIKVNINWTVNQCTEEIRKQAEEVEKVYTVYVVDDNDTLLGLVSLKRIILERASTRVSQILESNVISADIYTRGDDIANSMKKYDLVALPVVDTLNRLVGRITIDDIVDYIQEEADRDYQLLSGISEKVESDDKIWLLSRARLPWLIIGLVGGITNAVIIGNYDDVILNNVQLAFFMPLVAAMGGNAGVQSSSIIVQGLANATLNSNSILSRITREFMVSVINGLVCSAILFGITYLLGQNTQITLVVGISLFASIMFATVMGAIVPLFLDKLKINPALATGPFITTTNDLVGMFIYFFIGNLLI
jgi:magnesium transporter